jgi:hypothetical protein
MSLERVPKVIQADARLTQDTLNGANHWNSMHRRRDAPISLRQPYVRARLPHY